MLRYTTIADETPVGICGSGLVDAAAALLETGQLDETGAMDNDEESIAPGVALTGQDIRKLQLAKGAIAAGIRTLCKTVGIADRWTLSMWPRLWRAPDMDNAAKSAPSRALVQKRCLGNAALAGAMMMLLGRDL